MFPLARSITLSVLAAAFGLLPFHATALAAPDLVTDLKLPEVEFRVFEQNNVSGMAQDRQGRLYFGGQGGLGTFDGQSWESYEVPITPTLGLRVAGTGDGSIFLGLGRGTLRPADPEGRRFEIADHAWNDLVRLKNGVFTRFGTKDGLPGPNVWSLHAAHDGALWIGTDHGAARFAAGAFQTFKAGLPDPLVLALHVDRAGRVWFGTAAGLAWLDKGAVVAGLVPWPVQALAEKADGSLLVGTPRGVFSVKNLAVTRVLTRTDGLVSDDARALLVDRWDRLWVGTPVGLTRLDQRGAVTYRTVDGLAGENVLSLFEDREGGVWVGARGAMTTRIRDRAVWNLGPPEGLSGEVGRAVLRARAGAMWMATSEGLARYEGGALKVFRSGVELPAFEPRSLAESADGSVWVGTEQGVVRLRNEAATLYRVRDGLMFDRIRFVMDDRADGLWVSFVGGTVAHYPRAVHGDFRAANRFPSGTTGLCTAEVSSGMIADDGAVWFGSEGAGATMIVGGRARCFKRADGLPSDTVTAILQAPDRAIWFATRMDSGLSRYHGGRFLNVGANQGLWCDSINALADDRRGNLWTSCGGGVSRISWVELTAAAAGKVAHLTPISFANADGMRSQEATFGSQPGAAVAPDGSLWATTLLGISIIAPPESEAVPIHPRAVLTRTSINGRAQSPTGQVVVKGMDADLEVFWSAATLANRNRLLFRHRLEGRDTEWTYETQARSAFYRRLPPGRYRFRLHVSNGYGGWSPEEAMLTLVIRAPFHRTTPFFIGILVLLMGLVYGVHRLRLNRLAARHAVVADERNRLARELHDALGQTFTSIGMLLDTLAGRLKQRGDASADLATQARRVLDYSNKELRRIIWDLRDVVVQGADLSQILHRVVERVRETVPSGGPVIGFQATGTPCRSGILKHELAPLLAEALTNALRHANARHITVTVAGQAEVITLTIKDDGIGMATDLEQLAAAGHFGIVGMRERARRLGARFSLTSIAAGGTEISIVHAGSRGEQEGDEKSAQKSDGHPV